MAEEDGELETRADYKYCPQCLAAVPADAADCVHCGWRPGTPAYPDLNRTLVIPAWSQESARLLESRVRADNAPAAAANEAVPSGSPAQEAQWLVGPKREAVEAAAAEDAAPAAAATPAAAVADGVTETIADVPSPQVSADEMNLLTEPLLEEESTLHPTADGKSQLRRIILWAVGALMFAAALVVILRQSDDLRYGWAWRIAGSILALAGAAIALTPNVLSRRSRKKPPRQ